MDELVFIVEETSDGGFTARGLEESIFTEANSIPDLHDKVRDAIRCHFDENERPKTIRLRYVREVVIPA